MQYTGGHHMEEVLDAQRPHWEQIKFIPICEICDMMPL
jgi:hypothetical protein